MFTRAVTVIVAALGLTVGQALLLAGPAAAAGEFVEVTPSTVRAGDLVGLRASCGDGDANSRPATVVSGAFGRMTVRPQQGVLTAAATVPADQRAGDYRVGLVCPNRRAARTTLHVLGAIRPSQGPATGFGGTADAGRNSATLLVTGGLAAIAVGAALGLVTLRRRRTGA